MLHSTPTGTLPESHCWKGVTIYGHKTPTLPTSGDHTRQSDDFHASDVIVSPSENHQKVRVNHKSRKGNDQEILKRISTSDSFLLVRDYLEDLNTPRSLTVWMLFKYGEHRTLVELAIDPLSYNDPSVFRRDYAATKFLSKCVGLTTNIDLKAVALASAEEAELRCKQTNDRFRKNRIFPDVNQADYNSKFFRASQVIASILGPVPDIFPDVGWSPGRTSSAWGDDVASMLKYTSCPDVTVSARSYAVRLLRDSPQWGASVLNADGPVSILQQGLNVIVGNTLITVPKSAKTDRVICYEPHMNIRLQLAAGQYIRRRLLIRGINLADQSINRRRASIGSIDGSLATLDLSSASDTIASELVYELLPVDWALLLDQLRSKHTLWPDGSTRKNEKFSSMGNGFTFELESLIFYALASAVTENVSVYGDDLIFPNERFTEVSDLLEYSGFVINKRKSFSSSYFRESCGNDVFCGVVCTPVYLRRLPKTKEDVLKLHNAVRAWHGRAFQPQVSYRLCREPIKPTTSAMRMLAKWRSIHTCLCGPSGYGDGHYHVDFEDLTPKRASFEIDGWWFQSYIRAYRINTMYGDRVSGRFSERYFRAALCATLGPKSVRSLVDATVDRRQWKYKRCRVLANFIWPGIVWG